MKIRLHWIQDGSLGASDGRQYRVRGGVAHIKPEDWPAWQSTSHTRITTHPIDPTKQIMHKLDPEVLDTDTEPVYVDDPERKGDYSIPGGASANPADVVTAIRSMSETDRDSIIAALKGEDDALGKAQRENAALKERLERMEAAEAQHAALRSDPPTRHDDDAHAAAVAKPARSHRRSTSTSGSK